MKRGCHFFTHPAKERTVATPIVEPWVQPPGRRVIWMTCQPAR